jgi:hypothetical protein
MEPNDALDYRRYDPKALLLVALQLYEIPVLQDRGPRVDVPPHYTVEVEGPGLYKLLDQGSVVAPFADLDELCRFILHFP